MRVIRGRFLLEVFAEKFEGNFWEKVVLKTFATAFFLNTRVEDICGRVFLDTFARNFFTGGFCGKIWERLLILRKTFKEDLGEVFAEGF